jgi:paraquat-inducible protein B
MSEKANYFKIGLFFVISVILIVTAVIVWGAGLFAKDKIYFETYFDSPVTGLDVGSSVELMGVKIGQVENIDFVSAIYDISTDIETVSRYERYVRVLCSISAEESKERVGDITDEQREARTRNLIRQGLRLRLASNILTGQAYLEGVFVDPNRFPILAITWEPKHIYVASAPGEFSTLKQSVDQILYKLEKIDTEKIGLAIEEVLVSLKEAIRDANVPEITAQLTKTLERIDKLVASQKPEIEQSLENLREVSVNLKDLTESLKRHPSELIFSKPPPKSEILK